MRTEKLVNWLQVLGNFGLIAGLGLVAVQIQQNTDITRAQMISEDRGLAIALKLAEVGENPAKSVAKAIEAPDQLTMEDMVVLTNLQLANYYHKSRNEMLYSMGFGTKTDHFATPANNAISTVYEYVGNPYGLALWKFWAEDDGITSAPWGNGGMTLGPWGNGAPLTAQAIEDALKIHPRPELIMAERFQSVLAKMAGMTEASGANAAPR